MTEDRPPVAGTVIRYSYLWRREADEGGHSGRKHRPAAIIVARTAGGETLVVPITHSEPSDPAMAIEVPAEERQRIGLDDERSWIIVAEFNAFVWPGPDTHPIPGRDPETCVYGRLSRAFFTRVLFQVQTLIRASLIARVGR